MSGSRMSGRIGSGLFNANPLQPDAQALVPDADYVRKGAYFQSLTGVAITRLGVGDWFYAVSTGASAITVTLPAVADEVGHHHVVKKVDSGAGTVNIVAADGTAILDGSATHSIAAQYGVRCYFSDGDAYRSTGANATAGTGEVTSGTYTPTLTNGANVAASTAYQIQFLRVGNVVHVSGKVDVDPTAAGGTVTQLGISLPIASDIASDENLCGASNTRQIDQPGVLIGNAAGNDVLMEFSAANTGNAGHYFTFSYLVL